ncbi:MAG: hypothetical protein ABI042_03260 [Verrucomicrobiota bacterium]
MPCTPNRKNGGPRNSTEYQPMPSTGRLKKNTDWSLNKLRDNIDNELQDHPPYLYVVKSLVKNKDGTFGQKGCAPNFQGGLITLCTCKHKDRAYPPKRGLKLTTWKKMWVAGICSPSAFRPRGLFYLMLVERVYDSHADAWFGLNNPVSKSASDNVFGDIYKPLTKTSKKWKESEYVKTILGHKHNNRNDRLRDIQWAYNNNHNHPKLLVGKPSQSYLWSKPMII